MSSLSAPTLDEPVGVRLAGHGIPKKLVSAVRATLKHQVELGGGGGGVIGLQDAGVALTISPSAQNVTPSA
jgi:hypothetical protein